MKDSIMLIENVAFKEHVILAIKFNVVLLIVCLLLFLASKFIPDSFRYPIKSNFIKTKVLPTVYFGSFSFCLGLIFLFGVKDLKPFLSDIIHEEILDIGIIAAYTGSVSLLMSVFIKRIIEHIIETKIPSYLLSDVFGFIMGRAILLILYNFIE